MKKALMIIVVAVLIAVALFGAIWLYKNVKASSVPDEHKTPLPPEDPISYSAQIGGEAVEVMWGATAELQSLLMSLFIPHSFTFEYGSVEIVVDSPAIEAGMLFLAITLALVIIWKVRK